MATERTEVGLTPYRLLSTGLTAVNIQNGITGKAVRLLAPENHASTAQFTAQLRPTESPVPGVEGWRKSDELHLPSRKC
ncbi:MAG TPA: hypothetical protein VGF82_19635 [Terracidiphilus sp.]